MNLPARLGKYELVEFLGGGMSHVFRATDTLIGRTVAVKILTPEGSKDQDVKDRFLMEARMAGNISHENVISIYDFGEIEGLPFLVMEFLQGDSLRTLIRDGRAGDLDRKLQIALQTASALEYVHTQQIIHRDIKPDNVHVNAKGVAKLIDFGIAKVQDVQRTQAGFILGTPYYMAPEQVRGDKITPQVDVYAFGVLMFELMTGVKPFKAESVEQIFHNILSVEIDPMPLRQAGLPPPLSELISQCLAKVPAARPAGFSEVVRRLEEIAAPARPPQPQLIVEAPQPQHTLLYAGIAVGVVLVLILAFFVFSKKPSEARIQPPAPVQAQPLAPSVATPTGEMILIPAGPFESGEDRRQETVPDYYMDKTEVTNAVYQQYCKAKARPLPEDFPEDHPADPVANITAVDAMDFAKWAGKRLPSMVEWEKAARGSDGRIYPWGNDADPHFANLSQDGKSPGKLWPAGEAAKDVSPFGILNMGGNVSEFVDQLRTPSDAAMNHFKTLVNPPPTIHEAWYTFRGGSYRHPLANAVTYQWGAIPARFHGPDLGFRCVRDARPPAEGGSR